MGATRILCIDGGGIRGIIPATLLITFEKSLQKYSRRSDARIADFFDLIARTSTGGILASIYLQPNSHNPHQAKFSAQEALQFYFEHDSEIFHFHLWHSIKNLAGLSGPKYSAHAL